ncbi:YfbM family protein [Nocardia sp. NPDC058497]|uniref:YfbM family protein n=1 Tax=Nocardia sp. NPDC058497 TaxID=3346529 RepID=UPI003667D362
MGLVFAFHRISDDDAARIIADVATAFDLIDAINRNGEPAGDIDKAWDGLHYLLGAAGVGFDLLREDEPSRDEACTTVWSAEEVAAAALSLAATPFDLLAEHFDPEELGKEGIYPDIWESEWSLDYLRDHYIGLQEFFTHAAATGSPVVGRFE